MKICPGPSPGKGGWRARQAALCLWRGATLPRMKRGRPRDDVVIIPGLDAPALSSEDTSFPLVENRRLLPALTGALEVGTIVALLCVPEPGHGVSELRV